MEPRPKIKAIDGTAVRCWADRCEQPATFLFVGTSGERWAYCGEHTKVKAQRENLELPTTDGGGLTGFATGTRRRPTEPPRHITPRSPGPA